MDGDTQLRHQILPPDLNMAKTMQIEATEPSKDKHSSDRFFSTIPTGRTVQANHRSHMKNRDPRLRRGVILTEWSCRVQGTERPPGGTLAPPWPPPLSSRREIRSSRRMGVVYDECIAEIKRERGGIYAADGRERSSWLLSFR
jgi:hypothetical protein